MRHPDQKRRGPVLVSALQKFVTYVLTHLLTAPDPHGAETLWILCYVTSNNTKHSLLNATETVKCFETPLQDIALKRSATAEMTLKVTGDRKWWHSIRYDIFCQRSSKAESIWHHFWDNCKYVNKYLWILDSMRWFLHHRSRSPPGGTQ